MAADLRALQSPSSWRSNEIRNGTPARPAPRQASSRPSP